MRPIIFYPVGGYQIQITSDLNGGFSKEEIFNSPRFFTEKSIKSLSGIVRSEQLREIGIDAGFPKYFACREANITILIPYRFIFILRVFLNRQVKMMIRYARDKVSLFRLWAREDLLDVMLSPKSDLRAYLDAIRRYTFFEDYTFWEYNEETKVFVCLASSRAVRADFIEEAEGSSLNQALKDGYVYEARLAKKQKYIFFDEKSIPFLVRIKVALGADKSIGILNLYTGRYGFSIGDETISKIKRAVEAKYNETLRGSQADIISLNEMILDSSKSKESVTALLRKFVRRAADSFKFESCSIFILDVTGAKLDLVAQSDILHDGEPTENVSYSLATRKSLTVKVFRERRLKWSYDLVRDSENSHHFSEKTRNPAKNWIGVPILDSNSGRPIGVIRFKNKYAWAGRTMVQAHPTYDDFKNIYSIVMHLDNYVSLRVMIDITKKKSEDLSRFVRIFMHEVRAPISTFSSAPEKIKDHIVGAGFADERKVVKLLDDIKAMGARLKFLTDCYSVDKIIEAKSIGRLSFLEDVYYPVMNITRHHHALVSGAYFDTDQLHMHGVKILADKSFCAIILNALIDNAVKYADEDARVVRVGARPLKDGFFSLVVENEGIGVCDDELERIFEEGERGRLAQDSRIPGYGIGLSISRRLVREMGGDLLIESGINPFRIVLVLPAEI